MTFHMKYFQLISKQKRSKTRQQTIPHNDSRPHVQCQGQVRARTVHAIDKQKRLIRRLYQIQSTV